jgi:Lon protease-like protein
VIETTGTFGVILPPCTQSCLVVNHGTIVKITNFEPLLSCDIVSTIDGNLPRYVVQVTGLHRFKIEETRLTDGNYFEAQSIRVEDIEVDDGPWDIKALGKLVLLSRSYVEKLFASLPPTARQHFESKHGPIPLDPTDLSYWLAEFLPLNPYTLYQILPLNRVTKRLQLLCNWMQAASNNHEVK